MKLLLATDGSPAVQTAVGFFKTVECPPNSQLIILDVFTRVFQTEPALATYRTQQAEWLQLSQDLIIIRRREEERFYKKPVQP